MNILSAIGEDIDFELLGSATVDTTAGRFRSGWARCGIVMTQQTGAWARSYPFGGGAVTSAWLSFRVYPENLSGTSAPMIGLGLSGTSLYIGLATSSSSANKVTLVTYNGSSLTVLATEGGASLAATTSIKFDIQVSNFGATATVNVYANGTLIISYSGSTTITGMTNFDSVFLPVVVASNINWEFSEIIVADSDTRALLGLNTLALTGAGTTTQWSNNTYTNINGISYSDASPTYVNVTAKDQEYTVGTAQPAVFSVVGVVISARVAVSASSSVAHVKLGYGSGGVGYFGTGAQKAPTVAFEDYQQIDQTNPITSAAWASSDITAPLQLDIQSVT